LGWNFLTQVGTEIKCAVHEVIIPARNRHKGWLEEKLSVAVVQRASEEYDTTKFMEAELSSFSSMKGTANMAEINAKVDELLQMGYIEHSTSSPIVMVKKMTGKWKLCVDFRQINEKSIKEAYPKPRINYTLDQLREASAAWT